MYWLDGQPAQQIALTDRALHYGDGCFTTIRVLAGKAKLLALHQQRLHQTAQFLQLPSLCWITLQQEIEQAAQHVNDGVLKVILSRGDATRGYSPTGAAAVRRIMLTSPLPTHYANWRQQGISLQLSTIRLARNPLLAGHKHLNRLEQVLIRAELDRTDGQETLVVDSADYLVECCSANLFWRCGESVFTPQLDQAGVAGVMRQHILNRLADSPYQIEQGHWPVDVLEHADEVLICNALLPIVSVHTINTNRYISRELYNWLINEDVIDA